MRDAAIEHMADILQLPDPFDREGQLEEEN
jgi:hypothetical protein